MSSAALAIVSGRPILEIDHFLAPLHLPAAGLHGAERRASDGTVHRLTVDQTQVAAMRTAGQHLVDQHPGLLMEDKGIGVAMHYRQAPEHAHAVRRFALTQVAPRRREFAIQPGKMVVEIKPRRMNKGSAVVLFMNEAPFKGKTPVFVGDDLTDEKGYAAVHKMGGISVKIGAGPTRAQIRLPDVAALHAWLAQLTAGAPPSRKQEVSA